MGMVNICPIKMKQLKLPEPRTWGGKRKNAGRKRVAGIPGVRHRIRPVHRENHPVHVTMRRHADVPSLRNHRAHIALRDSIRFAQRGEFRILHYSVQRNHVHLIIEASDKLSVSRGMQGLAIRMAKSVNRVLKRDGRVWGDRYHARELTTPREVKNAIAYVLLNFQKHGHFTDGGIDRCSSGFWFDGWKVRITISGDPSPVVSGKSWFSWGWKRCGLVERVRLRPTTFRSWPRNPSRSRG